MSSDGRRGRLVVLEGGEGSGKSTQAALLAASLGALLTGEPGGTPVGRRIRSLVLDPDFGALEPRAEALLLAADRAQHVAEVIRPALEAGTDVVADRFVGSSLAYQGYGRGLDLAVLRQLSAWATGGLEPDLVVLLDVPPDIAWARLDQRHPLGRRDRMEAEAPAFHQRVAEGFRQLARLDPTRWVVVDGIGTVEEVATLVRAAWSARIEARMNR